MRTSQALLYLSPTHFLSHLTHCSDAFKEWRLLEISERYLYLAPAVYSERTVTQQLLGARLAIHRPTVVIDSPSLSPSEPRFHGMTPLLLRVSPRNNLIFRLASYIICRQTRILQVICLEGTLHGGQCMWRTGGHTPTGHVLVDLTTHRTPPRANL